MTLEIVGVGETESLQELNRNLGEFPDREMKSDLIVYRKSFP